MFFEDLVFYRVNEFHLKSDEAIHRVYHPHYQYEQEMMIEFYLDSFHQVIHESLILFVLYLELILFEFHQMSLPSYIQHISLYIHCKKN